jgi:hypothetical protein
VSAYGRAALLASFTLDVLAILAGAFAMLVLLLAWFGAWTRSPVIPFEDGQTTELRDLIAVTDDDEHLITMPSHLKTHSEMVAWMTQELPKLTAKAGAKPQRL